MSMILFINIYGQSSLDLLSFNGDLRDYKHRLNSFESNPVNFINKGDWQLGASFNSILGNDPSNGLFALSIGKAMGDNYFYARFSPGIYSQFRFINAKTISTFDNLEIESDLSTELTYSENFGFGYSYKISDDLTVGTSIRYFNQKFDEQSPLLILTSDSINYISTETISTELNYWRGDFGFRYNLFKDLSLSFSSINLLILNENDTVSSYDMKKDKGLQIGAEYNILNGLSVFGNFENNGSFNFSISHEIDFFNGKIGYSISTMHDEYQSPFIASLIPKLNYTNDVLSITLSYIKYTTDRTQTFLLNEFQEDNIYNITNNRFSPDKLQLNLNIALSFIPEKNVRFIDIEYVNNIYPTLVDEYYDKPFAKAKVLNLSNKQITVKP